jgi:hypothetical protein
MEPRAKLPSRRISLPVKRAGPEYAVAQSETISAETIPAETISADTISAEQQIVYLVSPNPGIKDTPFAGLIKCRGTGKAVRSRLRTPKPDIDAHLLLVLADQELTEGREEQARYLVEAAYEAFDRKAEAEVHILRRCD